MTDSGQPDAPNTLCSSSKDCALPSPVCSHNVCVGVSALVSSTTSSACVLLKDQSLWCWGGNGSGQLGRGLAGGQFYTPAPVTVIPTNLPVVSAGMGVDFGCALASDEQVYCWGAGVAGGGKASATTVTLPTKAVELSANGSGACARLKDGSVYCWGSNTYGDLGCDADAGSLPSFPTAPRLLYSSPKVLEIAVGWDDTCLRLSDDQILCFGSSVYGGSGDGRRANGNFFCWGANRAQTGLLWPADPDPVWAIAKQLPLPTNYTPQVAIGWRHSCAVDPAGTVTCWGQSDHAQTGVTQAGIVAPRPILGLTSVSQIAAYRHFSCALQADGQVLCWGSNEQSTIGPGNSDSPQPLAVSW